MFAGIHSYDELNKMVTVKRSEPYSKYFGDMKLTEEEKEARIVLAKEMHKNFLPVFVLLFTMQQYKAIDYELLQKKIENSYLKSVQIATIYGLAVADEYIKQYAKDLSYEIIESTQRHSDDLWYYSSDRVTFIAENESNTYCNHQDYIKAVSSGKKHKKWIDVRDNKERPTHLAVGQTKKPIKKPFLVGKSLMQYPKDYSMGAEPKEICNCRCTIKYF